MSSSGMPCEVELVSLGHDPFDVDSQRTVAGLLDDSLTAVGNGDSTEDVFVLPDEAILRHFDSKRCTTFTGFDRWVRLHLFDAEGKSTKLQNCFSAECSVMRDFADDFPTRASLDGAANQVGGDVGFTNAQRNER